MADVITGARLVKNNPIF
jgi:hypothetical protein